MNLIWVKNPEKKGKRGYNYLQVIRTLKLLVLPVDNSVYLTVLSVPQVREPKSNEVPLNCKPGK